MKPTTQSNLRTPSLRNIKGKNYSSTRELTKVIPITLEQQEIWTSCKLGGDDANRAYNESTTVVLKGRVDQMVIQKSLRELIHRHESLQSVFSNDGRFMCVLKHVDFDYVYHDFEALTEDEKGKSIKKYLNDDVNHLFNLNESPLIKTGLLKFSESEHHLVIMVHHIICDGWSLGILMQELGEIYSAHVENRKPSLPDPESFAEYSHAQQELISGKEYQEIENFWLNQYRNEVPQLELPIDFKRPSERTNESQRLDFVINNELVKSLQQFGAKSGSSFVTTLIAAFEVFLSQLTGQTDLVLGLPTAGQSSTGKAQLVGHCVNLLPIRGKVDNSLSFRDYLQKRKTELFDVYDHQQLSFGHLLKKLNIPRDPSRVPLVPMVLNIELGMDEGVSFSGLDFELISNPRNYETFEIFLNVYGSKDKVIFEWSYLTSLFRSSTIEQFMKSFESLLGELIENPGYELSLFQKKDSFEEYEVLNSTDFNFPEQPLNELLENSLFVFGDKTALKFEGKETSFKELHEKANQVANHLIQKGVKPGEYVGLYLTRSANLVAALLGILKAGAAYLPMDPSYPGKRLDFMLRDAETRILVSESELASSLNFEGEIVDVIKVLGDSASTKKSKPEVSVSLDDPAYLLYTSGSTGKPKGVPVSHKSLVNLLYSIGNQPGMTAQDSILAITTISFDIAAVEILLPLLKGARIVLADEISVKDSRLLLNTLKKENISILQATPTTWQMLLDAGWNEALPIKAFCGGEALSKSLSTELLTRCNELWNMYGPTETSIYSIINKVNADDNVITIGKPIANTKIYLLNENDNLVAPGKEGEIVISGAGLSKGYHYRVELTEQKFLTKRINGNSSVKIYKTGDQGRLLKNGKVEYLGRLDHQIKIRGQRIESGEVENAILQFEEVKSAVVVAERDKLVAYILPAKKRLEYGDLRQSLKKELRSELPEAYVPQEIRILSDLPKTPNGKIDRKALKEYQITLKVEKEESQEDLSLTEKLVSDVWKECLFLDQVGKDDDFFEIGGHSLVAIQVMMRLEKETNQQLSLNTLMEYSTVSKLAKFLDSKSDSGSYEGLVPLKPHGSKNPIYLVHGVGLNVRKFNSLIEKLNTDQPVFGLQGLGLHGKDESEYTVEEIASHYIDSIIKSNPDGPYALLGHSFGGVIIYEMARQLNQMGKKITTLAMLDSYVHPSMYYSNPFRKKLASWSYQAGKKLSVIAEISKGWNEFKSYLKRKREYVIEQSFIGRKNRTEEEQVEFERVMQLDEMNEQIIGRYQLKPSNFKIDLFKAQKKMFHMHDPIFMGWDRISKQGVTVFNVPGTHLNMFKPPYDKISARIIQEVIDMRTNEAVNAANPSNHD